MKQLGAQQLSSKDRVGVVPWRVCFFSPPVPAMIWTAVWLFSCKDLNMFWLKFQLASIHKWLTSRIDLTGLQQDVRIRVPLQPSNGC